jgi:hypothetical protein
VRLANSVREGAGLTNPTARFIATGKMSTRIVQSATMINALVEDERPTVLTKAATANQNKV